MLVRNAITRVRSLLAEQEAGFYSNDEIITWLNEGNLDFHNKKGIETIWTSTITNNTTEVSIDPTMVKLSRLYYTKEGTTARVYIPPSTYAIFAKRIVFDNELSAGTLTWYGEKLPDEISTTNDTITVPTEFENAIINYAVYRALEKDQNPNAQIFLGRYLQLKNQYEIKNIDKNAGGKVRIFKGW